MAYTPKIIPATQLTATVAVYYTASANSKATKITALSVTNTTGTNRSFTAYLVPAGGSPTAANQVSPGVTVPAGSVYLPWEIIGQMLPPGGTLQCLSDASSALTLSGAVVEAS